MNTLMLKNATQEKVVYLYFPEGRGEPGEIQMDLKENDAVVSVRASGDNSAEHYGFKAIRAVRECVDRKNLPMDFTQAWN